MPKKSLDQFGRVPSMLVATLAIGQWEDDVESDRIQGDAVMARLFGIPEQEMTEGITLTRLISTYHPEDRSTDTAHRRRVRADGGSFAWEHRVLAASGEVRWLLARGRFVRDSDGRVRGRGIVIDMTDTRVHDHGPSPAAFLASDGGGPPLERMADRVLEAWELSGDIAESDWARLRPLFETLLLELGRQIAAKLPEGPAHPTQSTRRRGIH